MADRFFCDRDCRRDGKSFKPLPESRFVELSKTCTKATPMLIKKRVLQGAEFVD